MTMGKKDNKKASSSTVRECYSKYQLWYSWLIPGISCYSLTLAFVSPWLVGVSEVVAGLVCVSVSVVVVAPEEGMAAGDAGVLVGLEEVVPASTSPSF
jgi:hypothetical protein